MNHYYLDENYGRKLTLPACVPASHAQALQTLMCEKDLALLLIVEADEGGYRQWLTGMATLERFSAGGIIVPSEGPVWLITGNTLPETEQSETYRVQTHTNPYSFHQSNGFCQQTLDRLLAGKKRIGTVHGQKMRTTLHAFLTQTLGCELIDVTMDAERCKMKKLPAEREAMRLAARQTARLLSSAQGIFELGLTLREACVELRRCAYRLGCFGADDGISSGLSLQVYPGENTQEHENVLHESDCIGLHTCCVWDDARYSIGARVFALDKELPAALRTLWNAACEAQRAAAHAIRPGVSLQTVADVANKVLCAHGCCTDPSRFLFAIGCARQERPFLLDESEAWPLEESTILAIAPTAALPSGQQLCCADLFEVTADGCVPLVPLCHDPMLLR